MDAKIRETVKSLVEMLTHNLDLEIVPPETTEEEVKPQYVFCQVFEILAPLPRIERKTIAKALDAYFNPE